MKLYKTFTTLTLSLMTILIFNGFNNKTANNEAPTFTSITLESNTSTLNIGEKVMLTLFGTYPDNSTEVLTKNIEYIITPSQSVELNVSTLTVLKDGTVTLQAKVSTYFSNTLTLNIVWVVDGHVLPPEPDSAVNNATLLGVDVNDNGVRDDVERWIYETYKDKHPIHIDIAMQGAREKQKMLSHPEKAKEIHERMVAPIDCESYYRTCISKPLVNDRINGRNFRKVIFNTKERIDTYNKYDTLLSGDSYTIPWCSKRKEKCDFSTNKYDKE